MFKLGAFLLMAVLMSGCVWPHKEWAAPPASGLVLDARSRQPISGVVVSRLPPVPALTKTDARGAFDLPGVRKVRWLQLDSVPVVLYRFEAAGYQSFETRRTRPGWSFTKDLRDEIGEIQLQPK
jgi:hypothetical protein